MFVLLSTDEGASVAEGAKCEVKVGTDDAKPVSFSCESRIDLLHFNIIFIHIREAIISAEYLICYTRLLDHRRQWSESDPQR